MSHSRRSWYQRFLPIVGLSMLSLITIPSVFTPGQMLCTAVDAPHFLYRLYEISWLAERGVLWPRWGPNLSYGYGYPVFHFYGSLSFYPSLLLHRLGLSLLDSFQAGFWLPFVLSGWTAYLWLRSVIGSERAALIGAIAYLYVPYHINTVIYRWNLPEPWAMAFFPLALYGLHRMVRKRDGRSVAVTALAVAALPLTSNLATLVFAPAWMTYALLLLFLSEDRRRLLQRQLAAAALSVAVSAFFVVPALVDRQAVQIERGFTPGGLNVFHNFLPLGRVFQQPFIADVSRANPLYDPLSIGCVVVGASLIALAARHRHVSRSSRWHAAWSTVLVIGCIFMATRASASVYRTLPSLQVLQFPWRFLAPASLLVGLLAGIAGQVCTSFLPDRGARMALIAVAGILVLLGWPLLYPGLLCNQVSRPGLSEAVAAQVGMVGSISTTAEYLPKTVQEIPRTSPMFDDYLANRPVNRWDQSRLPKDARVLDVRDDGLQATWKVETPIAFEAVYQAFMFPGWQATVDDRPVDIRVAPPYGLIQVHVPAGVHTITVQFSRTPERTAATAVSIAALCIAVGLLFVRGKTASVPLPRSLHTSEWIWVGATGIALLALRVGLVDRFGWLPQVRRFDGQTVRNVSHPTTVTYSGGERLLGYNVLTHPSSNGKDMELDLYWATDTGANFRALIRLVDEQGNNWTEWDKTVDWPGLIGPPAPRLWGLDRYTSMRYYVDIPLGTPPGEYRLSLAVIDPDTTAPHFVTAGVPRDAERTEAILGTVVVGRRKARASELAARFPEKTLTSVDGALVLLECGATKDRAQVGETVVLYPLWYARSTTSAETITLRLYDELGHPALARVYPLSSRYPTSQWQPGEVVRDLVQVLIPPGLLPGTYNWAVEVSGHEIPIGRLAVTVPQRHYELATDMVLVDETLDGFAELVGYKTGEIVPGQSLAVTLYWRARKETKTSYKAFVHVLDARGAIVAQSDGIPVGWTRPTTSWLPPESIEDTHTLLVPDKLAPGVYRLVAGLYEPATGERARTPDGQDTIVIAQVSIGQ